MGVDHGRSAKCARDLAAKTKSDISFCEPVRGHDFETKMSLDGFIEAYKSIGIQATNVSLAIDEINRMRDSKIFLGCTSNVVSCGLRETIRHIVKYGLVDVIVMTAGGVEEDVMKTMSPHLIGSFHESGAALRENGFNRIGNMIVPNENYFSFEGWFMGFLRKLTAGRTTNDPLITTPSEFIKMMGDEISDEDSVLYWASRNGIPIYSPALTDGSIGDMFTFFESRNLIKLDIVEDIYKMNREAMFADSETGAIILGGGLIKHHIFNANIFRNGLDYAVVINTSVDFTASDSGGPIEEAVSWGKVRPFNSAVKVFGEVSTIFPIVVAGSFLSGKSRKAD